MDNRIDFAGVVVAVCVAAYVAIMLVYVARNDLGLTGTEIRHFAVIAALFLALPVAIDFVRARTDKVR
ncbi:hypothetical protein ACFFWD_15325 [Bradyrhizobium erythrophlei]|uniref:hypothetical protein n=1 Tax=Bradyrhizobium erythrophlei TaxID=1437360 RepID=UPI0035ED5CAD